MRSKISLTALALLTTLSVSACGSPVNLNTTDGQYWQRSSVSDAAYQQGPKAQQMLNRDIASCVTELKELERLGSIRNAIPANTHNGKVYSRDEVALMEQDTPSREKYLFAEHGGFHDFETCMIYKGWERVAHVPFDVAHESRKNYLKAHINYEYQTKYERNEPKQYQTQDDGPYSDLND